jgi:glycerol-3-phosphate dehydrogenase subunit C
MREVTIKVSRFNPETDERPVLKEYKVPCRDEDSVLGGLLHIYEEIDSTLLFHYGCRYRLCGKCAIRINGRPMLACETPLEDGMVLEPLDHLPVIRDLAVDRSGLLEPLRRNKILLPPGDQVEAAIQPSEFYQLMRCNECLSCLSDCPVYGQKLGYDGPLFGARLAEIHYDVRNPEGLLPRLDFYLDRCILCKQCEVNCPWDLRFPEISTKIKGELFRQKKTSIRDWVMARPEWVGRIASRLALPVNGLFQKRAVRKVMDRILKVDERAPFPDYCRGSVRPKQSRKGKGKVAYFLGCFDKFNDPKTAEASLDVLEANGLDVELLDPGCCGAPFIGLGDLESARKRALSLSGEIEEEVRHGHDIVLSCPSCAIMVKKEYPALFHLLKGEVVKSRLFDLGDYLGRLHDAGAFEKRPKEIRKRIGYQVSCHLRAQNRGVPFLHLLKRVPGLEVAPLFNQCCGMAGTLGFKKEKFDLSQKVGEPLIESIRQSGLDLLLSDCASCRMKIGKEANVKTLHPIVILRESLIS